MYQENDLEKFLLKTLFLKKYFLDIFAFMLLTWMLTVCMMMLIYLCQNLFQKL